MLKPVDINPHNKEFDRDCGVVDRPIFGFYHLYCGPNDWPGIVSEQMSFIHNSGLADKLSKLYVTLVGAEADRKKALRMLEPLKYEIVAEYETGEHFEFPCLIKMRAIAEATKFYAFYFHTKGASYSNETGRYQNFEWKRLQCERWRRLMCHYVLSKWQMALNTLIGGYQAYGILYREKPRPHFSGNFWWARSEALREAPQLTEEFMSDRYNAEFWLLNNGTKCVKTYSPFVRGLLLAVKNVPTAQYVYPWYNWRNLVYLFMSYSFAKE